MDETVRWLKEIAIQLQIANRIAATGKLYTYEEHRAKVMANIEKEVRNAEEE